LCSVRNTKHNIHTCVCVAVNDLILVYCLFTQVGLIYVFNLIVGTGALTMPGAFVAAGWLLGLFFVVVLAFMRSVHQAGAG